MITDSYRIGLDVGSTTAKIVVTDKCGAIFFSKYERHHANIFETIVSFFNEVKQRITGNHPVAITITGSIGMGLAEKFDLPFTQEVVAATEFVKVVYPQISTIIDIGGEDAKIVYLKPNGNTDLRMNGNCAGGTGAFIDQMALLLDVPVENMGALAEKSEHIYPIASRCGVFSKTDVQNLISKNVNKSDIAASVFHAVAVQTVVTLSHGCEVIPKILFCGGPLTFIPALRQAFINYLHLSPNEYLTPENANIIPAWGASLVCTQDKMFTLDELIYLLTENNAKGEVKQTPRLPRIFCSEEEYILWKVKKSSNCINQIPLSKYAGYAYLGIDSGSTTTKIVVIDEHSRVLFSYYSPNRGNPIETIKKGLAELKDQCKDAGIELQIKGSCSTGYGEDLVKAAFNLNGGIIETIAHYAAARKINPNVSFILDIGGQDMKAIFVENGVLSRMEINEACSSGCGSFIEAFAHSLNYPVNTFAREACLAENPCDLGTRCTVFMNSKVKQVLREGASIGDIAAGLSYSVVKNCLYKVLKLKKTEELGTEIVVQGGTMRNDAIVRVLELLTKAEVSRSNLPELMGAYGCALYAQSSVTEEQSEVISLNELLQTADYTTRQAQCHGCENRCFVHKYTFANKNIYYSGNKCEKVFSNRGAQAIKGENLSVEKYKLLFNRQDKVETAMLTVGIPRGLNMYENYPFWHTLFNECGIKTALSDPSTFYNYETGVHSVMSDNICFPAKLMHSHIYDLIRKKVDRIFMPYVIFEKKEGKESTNSYNCPIVTGYSQVIKSAINPHIPIDSPIITFQNTELLTKQCIEYLLPFGIEKQTIKSAIQRAVATQAAYEEEIHKRNRQVYNQNKAEGKLTILLAGRPYHTDPLIQHKLSDMISEMGITVITEDIIRGEDVGDITQTFLVSQWAYINRIFHAAQWVAEQGNDIHFVQMTSFGCGPDAFLIDEIKSILGRHGKSLTLLKIDDVNNIGSTKLRVRSVIESLKFNHNVSRKIEPFLTTKKFTVADRKRTILIPYFTDYISPLIPPILKLAGHHVEILPESNNDSAECGLMYANNEVCYPATLVVGDIIKALKSGKYDTSQTAVIITQTGGQCRASNYIALIKKGIIEAGYPEVPVVSLAMGDSMMNEQPGFTINWMKVMPVTLAAILFSDCIAKFYHASAVREKNKGEAKKLRQHYLNEAGKFILANKPGALYQLIEVAAKYFNEIIIPEDNLPKVGLVGEIYLKFNGFANKNVAEWLIERKIEVMPPLLTGFFTQAFVNRKENIRTHIEKAGISEFVYDLFYKLVQKKINKVNKLASSFRYFTPIANIFEEAENGKEIVTLSAQFGEGWLLPAEIVSFAKEGTNNVISLQPFGCIANHIISKGVEKKIKTLYPQMNLLSLDYDSGVSEVNITNRLLLFTNGLK
ncbi:R-phenyllactate dehydratase activator [termite gut metagenome]|uniref:R-phenyllactate dehydratase activator n=1 Tax=termite gut metagenome TaxID=433724 RepID=A0A5J4SQJ6_9ZZZZ